MKLLVGADKQQVTCHKALLAYYSPFFDAALYGYFAESESNLIALPEDDPAEIQAFVNWCYTGTVDMKIGGIPGTKLWVLGDKLLSTGFMNTATMMVLARVNGYDLDPKEVAYVYDEVREGSKLHQLMRRLVYLEGPFRPDYHRPELVGRYRPLDLTPELEVAWSDLFGEGGQLVIDQVHTHGVYKDRTIQERTSYPWDDSHFEERYMENEGERNATDWRMGQLDNDAPVPPRNPCQRLPRD